MKNFWNELQKCISDKVVPWKLHDKQSVISDTLKGDIYRRWTAEIANLSADQYAYTVTDTGNGKDRRLDFFIHDPFDGHFDFVHLSFSSWMSLMVCFSSKDFSGIWEPIELFAASRNMTAVSFPYLPLELSESRGESLVRCAYATALALGTSERKYTQMPFEV